MLKNRGDSAGHVCVLAPKQLPARLHNRHMAAKPPKHLSKLQPDVPAPEHNQMPRHLVQFHDRSAIEKNHILQSADCRHSRPRSCIDKNSLAGKHALPAIAQPHEQRLRPRKNSFATNQLEIRCVFNPRFIASAKRIHDVALALSDALHVNPNVSGVNSIVRASLRQVCYTCARYHRFRRRTPFVHTRSAHMLALDQRRTQSRLRQRQAQRIPALPGTDNNRLKLIGRIHRRNSSSSRKTTRLTSWMRTALE